MKNAMKINAMKNRNKTRSVEHDLSKQEKECVPVWCNHCSLVALVTVILCCKLSTKLDVCLFNDLDGNLFYGQCSMYTRALTYKRR